MADGKPMMWFYPLESNGFYIYDEGAAIQPSRSIRPPCRNESVPYLKRRERILFYFRSVIIRIGNMSYPIYM